MEKPKSASRHKLLYYQRTLGRLWKATLVLGLIFVFLASWGWFQSIPLLDFQNDLLFFFAGVVCLAISLFTFVMQFFAYVQAFPTYLSVVTPFLRFKISYRRVRSVRPVLMQQLFPKNESSWSQRSFLEAFYGKTALVMELTGFPLDPNVLRLFLPRQMFSPISTGLVFVVPDWMLFSTELDSVQGAWRQAQGRRMREAGKTLK